jgi:hypothetical protein
VNKHFFKKNIFFFNRRGTGFLKKTAGLKSTLNPTIPEIPRQTKPYRIRGVLRHELKNRAAIHDNQLLLHAQDSYVDAV